MQPEQSRIGGTVKVVGHGIGVYGCLGGGVCGASGESSTRFSMLAEVKHVRLTRMIPKIFMIAMLPILKLVDAQRKWLRKFLELRQSLFVSCDVSPGQLGLFFVESSERRRSAAQK